MYKGTRAQAINSQKKSPSIYTEYVREYENHEWAVSCSLILLPQKGSASHCRLKEVQACLQGQFPFCMDALTASRLQFPLSALKLMSVNRRDLHK